VVREASVEQEVDEELTFHLEMHTRDLIASGMTPDAAREKAQQRLGDLCQLRRTCVSLGRKRNRMMRITQGQVKERPDEAEAQPNIYVPVAQNPPLGLSLVVRPVAGPAAALAPAVRAAIARIAPERPAGAVRTIAAINHQATSTARFRAILIGAFALLVLTLAVVGVFGVLAYSVQQRVREFGVRIALGATTSDVLAMVFGSTTRIIGVGIVVGLTAAAAVGRSMSSVLFGVQPMDPLTFGAVAVLLATTAMVATAIPALRAARVDPIVALRDE
jgi:putative ABC transport system permease protein